MKTIDRNISSVVCNYSDECKQTLFGDKIILSDDDRLIFERYKYDISHPVYINIIIDGIQTDYMISNVGTIKLYDKTVHQNTDAKGYLIVSLKVGYNYKTCKVHRLVAQAFIPNPENKPQVNHINGNKQCNWVGNLEWCTCQENIDHAIAHNLRYTGTGENANSSKYTNNIIEAVCILLEEGVLNNVEISKLTGVDKSTVSKIRCGKEWTDVSSNYCIYKRTQNAKGVQSASCKVTESQIHKICNLLFNQNIKNMKQIADSVGVSYNTVYRVKHRIHWTEISSEYINNTMSNTNSHTS